MPDALVPLYVVCRSEETAQAWRARSTHYEGLDIRCVVKATSYYAVINQVIAGADDVALIAHDDVWLSLDLAAYVAELLADLEAYFANWGLCGNAGVRWDGAISARHVADPHAGPQPFVGPRPALSVDGNLMLVNCRALRERGLARTPDLGGFQGYDLVLSFEALRRGLCVLIDPRLFAKHESRGDQSRFDAFVRGEAFQTFAAERFVDIRLPTINGLVSLDRREDFEHLDLQAGGAAERPSLLEAFDAGLAEARRRRPLRLAICVRTQFKRAALLERFFLSAAAAIRAAEALADIEIVVVTDQPVERAGNEIAELKRRFEKLNVSLLPHPISDGRASRVDLVAAAFDKLDADYLWFIDDDDYLLPSGAAYVARTLAPRPNQLVAVDCIYVEETWGATNGKDGAEFLRDSVSTGRTDGGKIFSVFDGDNTVPFCGVVYPRELMRGKLAAARARASYYEDYLLSLIALSIPEMSVETLPKLCCGISLRGPDNTVTETDRTVWNLSFATVIGEILARPGLANAVAWEAYRRGPPRERDDFQRLVADPALGEATADALILAPARPLARDAAAARGFVDRIDLEGDALEFVGWALDARKGRALDRVAVVFGDRVIALAPTHLTRGDVASAVGFPAEVRCGFKLRVQLIGGFHGLRFPEVWGVSGGLAAPLEARDCFGEKLREWVAVAQSRFRAEGFDEADYLARYDDVRRAIERGLCKTAFAHWIEIGAAERRVFRFAGQGDLCESDLDVVRGMFANAPKSHAPEESLGTENEGEPFAAQVD